MLSEYSVSHHTQAFSDFLAYKTRVPVRGAIMLNQSMDEVVLVKGWKKNANWSFPRGKINKDEPDLDCAVREVYEETGHDLKAAGLVLDEEHMKYIEVTMREQHMRLYVFRGVPMDTHFEPRTRKEISKIQWYKLTELPTVKKRKQQQETKGEDLAVNANKFYMVAPFLAPLKKWISQQRKLDKTSHSGQNAMLPEQQEYVEPAATENHQADDSNGVRPSTDDLHRLFYNLRQSSLQKPSDLPEVTEALVPPPTIIRPAPALSLLNAEEQAKKSSDLLALLRGEGALRPDQNPQTPAAQIIDQPTMPRSPPHHHLSRMPSHPAPPGFPFPPSNAQDSSVQAQGHSHIRPIPPPSQPAQFMLRSALVNQNGTGPAHKPGRLTPAPYQRTGDPQFSQTFPNYSGQHPSIPPASNLPPPKLTPHSAGLLNLFKRENPTKPPTPAGSVSSNIPREAITSTTPPKRSVFHQFSPQIPPQEDRQNNSRSGHQSALLDIFRATPASKTNPKRETNTLQPPAPVELSASPGQSRSRKPTKIELLGDENPPVASDRPVAIQKRLQHEGGKIGNLPVSATVNGPLNVPQFDVLAKQAKDANHSSHKNDTKPGKPLPVTVLARPTASQATPPNAIIASPNGKAPSQAKQQKASTKSLVTAVKIPPPKPSIQGQDIPAKPFQPQILRRPAKLQDLNEPSPIQPLPSPKHNIVEDAHRTLPADHRKSLLSLFTNPSPSISAPSETPPASNNIAALVSPIFEKPSLPQKFPVVNPPALPSPASHHQENVAFTAPDVTPEPRGSTLTSVPENGRKSGESNGKHTPTAPGNKDFLLGYLAGVVKGGR